MIDSTDFIEDERDPIKSDYCEIRFCTQKSTGRKCVQKKFIRKDKSEKMKKTYQHAIRILSKTDHPAIVPYVGYYESDEYVYLIEEEIEKGNLSDHIEKIEKDPLWDDTHKLIICYGIASAMEYLHKKLIVHRELCPKNILLDSEMHPYLSDFKLSMKAKPVTDKYQIVSAISPVYMAPEYMNDPFSSSGTLPIDVYSYGVTVYSIVTEIFPFSECKSKSKIFQDIVNGVRPVIPDNVPDHWKELMIKCWNKDSTERPTFTDICNMLESDIFLSGSISRHIFENYKRAIKPLRSSA